jgi:hypothetical protein
LKKKKNPLFEQIEQQSSVNMQEILKLANSLQTANLKDERTIRRLISTISRMVNMPVSKEKEEYIIKAIKNDKVPKSLADLMKMFKG